LFTLVDAQERHSAKMTRNVNHVGQLFPQGAAVRARWSFSKPENRRFIGIFRKKNLTGLKTSPELKQWK